MIFKPTELTRLNTFVSKAFERGKSVSVEPISGCKTISQNRYIWLVFTHVAQETGNTKDDIYQFCLQKFPTFKTIEVTETALIQLTLSGMSKEQTIFFIDQVVTYFWQEGFDIPSPDDLKCREIYEYYRERGMI
jgi:hypothetical protein